MNEIIPYGKHEITDEDCKAVIDALKSDYLTQGPKIIEFESKFAQYIGSKYAVAVANGTAALHLCTMVLGVSEGDKVITTPITFAASANCVKYCGGDVVFSDIDPKTYLIDIPKIEELLSKSPKGTFAGIIPVEFAGLATNLERLREIANEYNLWIIEDSCHAPGGYFIDSAGKKQNCGNGNFADLAIFSFHPVKHIATGEGGMITTNDVKLYNKLLHLRTHGITKNNKDFINEVSFANGTVNQIDFIQHSFPGWYMEMQELGYNYRLTDFQAALGISQLKRADNGLKKRREIAAKYEKAFTGKSWIKSHSGKIEGHAYHLYIIEVERRLELYNFLKSKNIYTQIHYIPTHLMPYYRNQGWNEGDMPNAELYYTRCISLPIYPTLTEQQQEFVINKIEIFFNEKSCNHPS
jgi:UDP-4-amino-4,6-dideoxy-N-acetyl-beta-L-altrosamine transaminase